MATGTRLRFDGVESYLTSQLDGGSITAALKDPLRHDGGISVESFKPGEYLAMSILDANYRLAEIVHVVNYAKDSTSLAIDRGMEGTRATTHAASSKIVHAATVDDFLLVQGHATDPTAHQAQITNICNQLIAAAIQQHELKANDRHPYYVMSDNANFTGPVTFSNTSTVNVNGTMTIKSGGKLVIEGELKVETGGKIVINGIELYLGNNPPPTIKANMVWIKTFGA